MLLTAASEDFATDMDQGGRQRASLEASLKRIGCYPACDVECSGREGLRPNDLQRKSGKVGSATEKAARGCDLLGKAVPVISIAIDTDVG